MQKYQNIIHLTRPKSAHAPMPRKKRAAQFAPFAALDGYEELVRASEHDAALKYAATSADVIIEDTEYIIENDSASELPPEDEMCYNNLYE